MSDRRVKVIFEAEIARFKQAMGLAAAETEKLAKSTEKTGKTVDERMQKINAVAAADQRAAKAAGLLYNAQGQLADANGKVLSSTQAAAHGVESFSEAVYLAGHDSEVAAAKSAAAAAKQKEAWEKLAPVMMTAGAGIVAGVGLAVAKYAEFDKSMSSVQAATHESTGNMNLLREAAIKAGADTAFSAAEAAQGIEELAKAGVSTESILNGGLNGALSLAAAGNLGVGESAEIAASAMTQFKLSGDQIPHLADLLAAGAGKAQGSVQDLGAALNQSGLVAASTGLSIEESTGALAAFASAGLTGSDAGTSFKTMLQSLNPNSNEAARLMDELGISAYDAEGKFIGMSEYAGVLQGALKDMSDEQRNATLKTIFGSDAVRAANVIYEQGAEGIQKWEDAVNDAGYAAETAAIMQDNLAGDVEKLGGALDSVFIQSGSGANDFLRGLAQSAEGVVDAIGQIPGPVLSATTSIAGVVGVTSLAVGGFIKLAPAVVESWSAFKDLGNEGSKMPGKLGKATQAVGILGATFAAAATAITLAAEARAALDKPVKASEIVNALSEITTKGEASAAALDKVFKGSLVTGGGAGLGGSTPTAVNDLASAMERLYNPSGFDKTVDFFGTILGPIYESGSETVRKNLTEMDSALTTLATSGAYEEAAAGFKLMHDQTIESGGSIDEVKKNASGYLDSLRDIASSVGVAVDEQALLNWALTGTAPAAVIAADAAKSTADAFTDVGVTAGGAVEDMEAFLETLFKLGNDTMDSRDAAAAYEEQIDSITKAQKEIAKGEMGKTLNKTKDDFDLATEAGRLANSEFQDLARSGMDEVAKMSEEGLGQDKLQEKLNTTYKDLVKAGEGFGLLPPQAKALAREVLGVPDGVSIKTWMEDKAKTTAEETTEAVNAIPDDKQVAVVVSEDGTAGEVQQRVNSITGKTEFVFVTDDGTTSVVQQGIVNVNGVDRTVWVDDKGTIIATQGDINNVRGKEVTITASASTSSAESVLAYLARDRSATINTRVVTTKETHETTGPGGRGGITRASGGSVFGAGTETSDSIPAWLSNNEHVLSAREVRGLGGHSAVERLRMMARMGDVPAFKSGGRVNWSSRDEVGAKRDRDAAKRELDRANKSKDEKRKKRAQKAYDAAKEEYEDARDRTKRLRESEFDLRRDVKRGDIRESFTSGSGMSVVDRMFDESNNKDLSKRQRRNLRNLAYKTEAELLRLEKRSDKLAKSLEKATDRRDELLSVKNDVASGLRGEFSLSGVLDQLQTVEGSGPLNAGAFVKSAKGKAAAFKRFGGLLEKLRKKGYSSAVIQEIASMGVIEGTQVGNALLSATTGEKNALNAAYKSMDYWAGQAGESVTKSMYKGGIDAAEGVVRGLESKQKDVESAFYKLGKSAEKSFKRSLGIKSPSRVMFGAGVNVGEGAELGILSKVGDVQGAMGKLAEVPAFSVPPSPEVARYSAQSAAPAVVIDYDRLAQAMANVQVQATVRIGNKEVAQANTAGRKELRLPV